MKIIIEQPPLGEEDSVIIRCKNPSLELLSLAAQMKSAFETVACYKNGSIYMIEPHDIFYYEAVDSKTFLYTENEVYEIKKKLYEIEDEQSGTSFIRISKSVILNLAKIQRLSPDFNGRFEAMLINGERVIISRQYVAALKYKLNIV